MSRGLYPLIALGVGCVDLTQRVPILVGDWCDDPRTVDIACVVDGDTVDVGACGDDQGERFRLLGVDAPEVTHADIEAECFGEESQAYLEYVVSGRSVRAEFDIQCTDIYDRTLGWLFVEGDADDPLHEDLLEFADLGVDEGESFEVLLNEVLVRAGYAEFYEEFGDVRYAERLEAAQAAAMQEGRGLWGECDAS